VLEAQKGVPTRIGREMAAHPFQEQPE
jgi:hypothetical protein